MKPVSVRFRCFGPYMQEQRIDFTQLEENGLFLICGETGAGKTTILDAICYALYGRSSGGLRGDLSVMRCKLAGKEDETLTEFVFDSNGKRYQFIRSLKYGRKNLNDTHNCLVMEDGVYVPIFENPKATVVNKKAEELIGLTYDQFRQVIILPQGQFEKLLVSDSAEKEKILVSLFHADRWQKIADELYRRVAEREGKLKQEKLQIQAKLREYGCETLEQLEEKRIQEAQSVEQLGRDLAASEAVLLLRRREQEQALLDNRVFQELSVREKRLKELELAEETWKKEEQLLQKADGAETIRPQYYAYQEEKRGKLRCQSQLTQAETALEAAVRKLQKAEESWHHHEAMGQQHEQNRKDIALLEDARELYGSLKSRQQAAVHGKKELEQADSAMNRARQVYDRWDKAWQQAILNQNQAMDAYRQAQGAYLKSIGSTLAQSLAEGQPCPVCGSLEHPKPAQQDADHVTESQLEEKNAAMNAANEAVSSAMTQRAKAETAWNEAQTARAQAAQTEALARADYENALARRIDGVEDERMLEQRIRTLKTQVEIYRQEEELLQKTLADARGAEMAAREKLDMARQELAAAVARYTAQVAVWQAALAESGLVTEEQYLAADMQPEEKQNRRMALAAFRTELVQVTQQVQSQREELKDRTAPDMAAVQKARKDAEDAYKAISARQILSADRLKTMTADAAMLQKRLETYEKERLTVEGDMDFANRLRGRSGVSLQRYVLGVMLTSITAEANRLLANVYGGRYRLYRTDEISGSGHKGGLELEVYDSQNNQRRSVTTLSGGEKFLVALSLAIGLSTVVQAQGGGIRLEAMFIDEGFGSLDKEAVHDALEVLQGIRRGSGIVGIISHVEQLAQIIPARLEITKGRQGSTCHVRL